MAQQALAQQTSGTAQPAEPPPQGSLYWMDNGIAVRPYGWKYAVDPEELSTANFEHAHDSAIDDLFFFIDGSWSRDVPDILGDDADSLGTARSVPGFPSANSSARTSHSRSGAMPRSSSGMC
jgi:hypothetical protein